MRSLAVLPLLVSLAACLTPATESVGIEIPPLTDQFEANYRLTWEAEPVEIRLKMEPARVLGPDGELHDGAVLHVAQIPDCPLHGTPRGEWRCSHGEEPRPPFGRVLPYEFGFLACGQWVWSKNVEGTGWEGLAVDRASEADLPPPFMLLQGHHLPIPASPPDANGLGPGGDPYRMAQGTIAGYEFAADLTADGLLAWYDPSYAEIRGIRGVWTLAYEEATPLPRFAISDEFRQSAWATPHDVRMGGARLAGTCPPFVRAGGAQPLGANWTPEDPGLPFSLHDAIAAARSNPGGAVALLLATHPDSFLASFALALPNDPGEWPVAQWILQWGAPGERAGAAATCHLLGETPVCLSHETRHQDPWPVVPEEPIDDLGAWIPVYDAIFPGSVSGSFSAGLQHSDGVWQVVGMVGSNVYDPESVGTPPQQRLVVDLATGRILEAGGRGMVTDLPRGP